MSTVKDREVRISVEADTRLTSFSEEVGDLVFRIAIDIASRENAAAPFIPVEEDHIKQAASRVLDWIQRGIQEGHLVCDKESVLEELRQCGEE